MRIYSMTATFGKLEHQTLTLKPGLNIIEAPNEWGKSTWCAFLVAMLYGIETKERTTQTALAVKERYAPWSGSPMEGRIDLSWNGRDITIERRTKGRSIFGEFRAYETESGLAVPELTGTNCGQMLLGVEKSVFTRAGFLRLSDLPVTQDEHLRNRLNALVTTGDESGTSDALAQQLRDLKNRCYLNRSNGLLPQAQAQKSELEEKLQELQQLQTRSEQIKQRQVQLEQNHKLLINHQSALEYAAGQTYLQKLAAAQAAQEAAAAKVQELETTCAHLPELSQLDEQLLLLQQLREQWDTLHMQAQLLPAEPVKSETPPAYVGLSPEDAAAQASTDVQVYRQANQEADKRLPTVLAYALALAGIGALLIPHWIGKAVGVAVILIGLLWGHSSRAARMRARNTADALVNKYAPLPPEQWVSAAERFAKDQSDYASQRSKYHADRAALDSRMADLKEKIQSLTGGDSLAACESEWKAARSSVAALAEARREYQRAETLTQALTASHKEVLPPQFPDTMTHSAQDTEKLLSDCILEQQQLQLQLGHCQGRMEALGQESLLRQQLSAVEDRIRQLETTYEALELAQNTLAAASAELQRRFAPRIAKRAQAIFSELTDQRYERLTLGEDLTVHAAAVEEATLHSTLWRSEGTADQLYLALRLAVAEELTPDAPLILDDALARFDDTRLARAMSILRDAAQAKQVIVFTCHSREAAHG